MNGSRTSMFRWLLALFVVMGLLATTGITAAQDDEDCLPADVAAFLDPDGDLFISVQELEGFVEFLRTIDPAEYEGDLEGDIAAIEKYIDWMYSNDVTGYDYVLCQVVPDPTVPPEVTPEPTLPPEVTPEPTTPPYVEPEPTVAPPVEEETWDEPEVVEPVAQVEVVEEPVVAQVAPAVVTLPNTGAGPATGNASTLTYASIALGCAMLLLASSLLTRRDSR